MFRPTFNAMCEQLAIQIRVVIKQSGDFKARLTKKHRIHLRVRLIAQGAKLNW